MKTGKAKVEDLKTRKRKQKTTEIKKRNVAKSAGSSCKADFGV
jgi:hypothetical protein